MYDRSFILQETKSMKTRMSLMAAVLVIALAGCALGEEKICLHKVECDNNGKILS